MNGIKLARYRIFQLHLPMGAAVTGMKYGVVEKTAGSPTILTVRKIDG